ncbi:MAG: hypothetical protein NC224_09830, partial [Bacteroides sp.]|nr:hypothetical protein [Bacteroides sp.]
RRTDFLRKVLKKYFQGERDFQAPFSAQNRAFFQIVSSKTSQPSFQCPEKQKWILNPKKDYFKTNFS